MSRFRIQEKSFHKQSISLPIGEIASCLSLVLGTRLAALVVGLSDPKAISAYAKNEREPQSDTSIKLRQAFHVVSILESGNLSKESIQSWFCGMNPDLDDEAPASVILENPRRVLEAARGFVFDDIDTDADGASLGDTALTSKPTVDSDPRQS